MEKTTRYLAVVSLFSLLVLTLYACGGGGGGGSTPPPTPVEPLSVSGNVSDSDRDPVDGASVTIYNASGVPVTTVSSNVAGNYEVRGLTVGIYSMAASGPTGTFPTELFGLDLTSGIAPTVDIYLPSTSPAVETSAGSEIYSQTSLANGYTASFDLSASTEIGTLTGVNLKPLDVTEFGIGQAAVVSPLLVDPSDYITQWYASAAVEMLGATIDGTGSPAVLNLPVPLAFQTLALPAQAPLYRLNTATMAWEEVDADASIVGVDPATLDSSVTNAWFFQADVLADGLYRVGEVSSDTVEIAGTVTYEDGSSAVVGATVYLNGGDYGYQQVVTTDATGSFAGYALGNAMTLDVTPCLKQGGILTCATTSLGVASSVDPVDIGSFSLPLTAGATTTLTIADDSEIGIVGASGRTYSDSSDIADYADIAIAVSTFGNPAGFVEAYVPDGTLNGGVIPITVSGAQTLTVVTPAGSTVIVTVTDVTDIGVGMDVTLSVGFVP